MIGEDEQRAGRYKFTSIEVKEQAFRFDGVFLPETDEDPIYFVEAQFSREKDFYPRFFGEIFVYLRQNQPISDWRAVVLYPEEATDTGIHRHYREFFESDRLRRVYVNKLSKDFIGRFPISLLQIILDSEQNIVSTVKNIVGQLPDKVSDAKEQEKIIALLINLLMSKLPQLSRKEIEKMVEPVFSDIKKSRFYQEIAEESYREMAKKLLKKQMSFEFISEVTGLSQEEILSLSKELAEPPN
ncbi:Rpn family recombination-promoting nuclease/putative transposase [bacterium]|nr:Rpn family recombination-promoting nuclease/putative transposase [bacterium]